MNSTLLALGSVVLPAKTTSVKAAREYVHGLLRAHGRSEVGDTLVLVSELVTNAIEHSDSGRLPGGQVTVEVYDDGKTVGVAVVDDGTTERTPMIPEQAGQLSVGGLGLLLVREMSSSWGWGQDDSGRRKVWFQLELP